MTRIRTITDFPRNEQGLVDHFLGTSYDVVKFVAKNFDKIEEIHQLQKNMDTFVDASMNESLHKAIAILEEQLNDNQNKIDKQFADNQKELDEQYKKEKERLEAELIRIKENYEAYLDEFSRASLNAIEETTTRNVRKLRIFSEEIADNLANQEKSIIAELEKQKEKHVLTLLNTTNAHIKSLNELKDTHSNTLNSGTLEHLNSLLQEHNRIATSLNTLHGSLSTNLSTKTDQLIAEHVEKIKKLSKAEQEVIKQLTANKIVEINNKTSESLASITQKEEEFIQDVIKDSLGEGTEVTVSQNTLTEELSKKINKEDTVGSGKVMREGANGIGAALSYEGLPTINESGVFGPGLGYARVKHAILGNLSFLNLNDEININGTTRWGTQIGIRKTTKLSDLNVYLWVTISGQKYGEVMLLSDKNTTPDKNGVLHNSTNTPLDTLNTSDMADTVIDNDELTITSGAVYRAIAKLEARIKELENK